MKIIYDSLNGEIINIYSNDLQTEYINTINNMAFSYAPIASNTSILEYSRTDVFGEKIYYAPNGVLKIKDTNTEVFTLEEIKNYYMSISVPTQTMSLSNFSHALYDHIATLLLKHDTGLTINYPVKSMNMITGEIENLSDIIELRNKFNELTNFKTAFYEAMIDKFSPIISTILTATTQEEITTLNITI